MLRLMIITVVLLAACNSTEPCVTVHQDQVTGSDLPFCPDKSTDAKHHTWVY